MGHGDPPPRYAYLENGPESMPMVSGSPKYQVIPAGQKRNAYQSIESAFIARTAVVSNYIRFKKLAEIFVKIEFNLIFTNIEVIIEKVTASIYLF